MPDHWGIGAGWQLNRGREAGLGGAAVFLIRIASVWIDLDAFVVRNNTCDSFQDCEAFLEPGFVSNPSFPHFPEIGSMNEIIVLLAILTTVLFLAVILYCVDLVRRRESSV